MPSIRYLACHAKFRKREARQRWQDKRWYPAPGGKSFPSIGVGLKEAPTVGSQRPRKHSSGSPAPASASSSRPERGEEPSPRVRRAPGGLARGHRRRRLRERDDTIEVARRLRPDVEIVLQNRTRQGQRHGVRLRAGDRRHRRHARRRRLGRPGRDPASTSPRCSRGADFAKGTRYRPRRRERRHHRAAQRRQPGLSRIVNLLFGTRYTDLCYGYNAFWRHCLPAMDLDCDGFEVETLINIRVARAGLKVGEVPSFERDRGLRREQPEHVQGRRAGSPHDLSSASATPPRPARSLDPDLYIEPAEAMKVEPA